MENYRYDKIIDDLEKNLQLNRDYSIDIIEECNAREAWRRTKRALWQQNGRGDRLVSTWSCEIIQ